MRETLAGYSFIEGSDVSLPPLAEQSRVPLPTEQFLQVTSGPPLSREELRALCDRYQTADAIQAALEAR